MDNSRRQEIYLRDRATLTPAQRRRVTKRARAEHAPISRNVMRRGRRDVLRRDAAVRSAIRSFFSRRAA